VKNNLEDRYVQKVREFSTAYGVVGDLSEREEHLVRRMFHDRVSVRLAGRMILRARGLWPAEPHPRRHLETGGGVRESHRPYGFR
jgi:hypothetical protein